jgi:hypothetical protein
MGAVFGWGTSAAPHVTEGGGENRFRSLGQLGGEFRVHG